MDASSVPFRPPSSPQDAHRRIESLRAKVETIQRELSPPAEPSSSRTARRWKRDTLAALMERRKELEFLQEWLRTHQAETTAGTLDVDLDDCEAILRVANDLIQTLRTEGRAQLSKFEGDMADLVRYYVLERGPEKK